MLGWIEGRNIQSFYRWAGPDPEKARTFAKELTGMKPDVIVSSTNQVTEILKHETRTIPIVFACGLTRRGLIRSNADTDYGK